MTLQKYKTFVNNFHPDEQYVFHYAVITERYFYLAESQAQAFQEAIDSAFSPEKKQTEASEKRYAFGFGVYIMLRTCLESSRRLNDYLDQNYHNQALADFRSTWRNEIMRIITITNNLIKHPLEDPSRDKDKFYEPGGSDSTGALTVYGYSTETDEEMILPEIHPISDFKVTYKYLEELADVYSSFIPG